MDILCWHEVISALISEYIFLLLHAIKYFFYFNFTCSYLQGPRMRNHLLIFSVFHLYLCCNKSVLKYFPTLECLPDVNQKPDRVIFTQNSVFIPHILTGGLLQCISLQNTVLWQGLELFWSIKNMCQKRPTTVIGTKQWDFPFELLFSSPDLIGSEI